jgi:hypothetical protein
MPPGGWSHSCSCDKLACRVGARRSQFDVPNGICSAVRGWSDCCYRVEDCSSRDVIAGGGLEQYYFTLLISLDTISTPARA